MNKILRKIRKTFYLNQIRPGPRFGRLLIDHFTRKMTSANSAIASNASSTYKLHLGIRDNILFRFITMSYFPNISVPLHP